jgi:uncharacterized protein YxjI
VRYVMMQRALSLGEDLSIRDEEGAVAFVVDGKAISLGQKAVMREGSGKELVFIKQKVAAITPTYEIHRDGRLHAEVKRSLRSLLRRKLTISTEFDSLLLDGNVMDLEFRVTRDGAVVAAISKKLFAMTDTYGVDIAEGEDPILPLAIVVVVDMMRSAEGRVLP